MGQNTYLIFFRVYSGAYLNAVEWKQVEEGPALFNQGSILLFVGVCTLLDGVENDPVQRVEELRLCLAQILHPCLPPAWVKKKFI